MYFPGWFHPVIAQAPTVGFSESTEGHSRPRPLPTVQNRVGTPRECENDFIVWMMTRYISKMCCLCIQFYHRYSQIFIYMILYDIILYYMIWYCIVLDYIILYHIILYYIILYYIILYSIVLYYIILHYITLHYITLHYIRLYYTILYYYIYIYICIILYIYMYVVPRLLLQKNLAPTLTAQGTWFHGDIQLVEIPEHRTHAIDGNHRNTMGIIWEILWIYSWWVGLQWEFAHVYTTYHHMVMQIYGEIYRIIEHDLENEIPRSLSVAVKHCRRASHRLLQHQTGTRRRCKSEVRKLGHCPSKLMLLYSLMIWWLKFFIPGMWLELRAIMRWFDCFRCFRSQKTVLLQTENCKPMCEAPSRPFLHSCHGASHSSRQRCTSLIPPTPQCPGLLNRGMAKAWQKPQHAPAANFHMENPSVVYNHPKMCMYMSHCKK